MATQGAALLQAMQNAEPLVKQKYYSEHTRSIHIGAKYAHFTITLNLLEEIAAHLFGTPLCPHC